MPHLDSEKAALRLRCHVGSGTHLDAGDGLWPNGASEPVGKSRERWHPQNGWLRLKDGFLGAV